MDKLAAMRAFARVAQAGSFIAAADQLGIGKSAISRLISDLESQFGVTLIQRTTRQMKLTPIGKAYLKDCIALLNQFEKVEERVTATAKKHVGTLRVGVFSSFGMIYLPDVFSLFRVKFPDVEVSLMLFDRWTDPVKAGIDLYISLGGQLPQAAVRRKISHTHIIACAAPSYLANHGAPEDPTQLVDHNCLSLSYSGIQYNIWGFSGNDQRKLHIKVKGNLESNHTMLLRSAALAGEGVTYLPTYIIGEDLANGALISLFPKLPALRYTLHGVYMSGQYLPARVRGFIDIMSRSWGEKPPWDIWLRKLGHCEEWVDGEAYGPTVGS